MAPHATDDGNMSNKSAPMTNGETPSSKILSVCTTLFSARSIPNPAPFNPSPPSIWESKMGFRDGHFMG